MIKKFVALQVWLSTSKKQKGQSLAEYGLILALVAVFCIAALQVLGGSVSGMLNQLATTIKGVPVAAG